MEKETELYLMKRINELEAQNRQLKMQLEHNNEPLFELIGALRISFCTFPDIKKYTILLRDIGYQKEISEATYNILRGAIDG